MFDELRVCLNPLFVCSQTEYPALPDSRAVLTMPMSLRTKTVFSGCIYRPIQGQSSQYPEATFFGRSTRAKQEIKSQNLKFNLLYQREGS